LEASRDYQAYEVKFRNRKPELILPNPWQTLEAIKVGYQVIAMAGDAEDFNGIFIVRKDSGINVLLGEVAAGALGSHIFSGNTGKESKR